MKTLKTLSVLFCILAFNGASIAAINDGLVAYYPFDGNANDATTNAAHGSNYTGLVTFAAGKLGQAAWFDGGSCIKLPHARLLDGASNATISAWIYFTGYNGAQLISAGDGRAGMDPITTSISANTAGDVKFGQVIDGKQALLGFSNGDSIPNLGSAEWHHFFMVLERKANYSAFRAYLDGDMVKYATSTDFSRIAYDKDMSALVGALDASAPNQFWRGAIDELRIYSRALSRAEILSLGPTLGANVKIDFSRVTIRWTAPTNKDSQVQFRSSLTGTEWINLGSVFTNRGENVFITDDVDGPQKFYRVVFLP